jgi:SpoVK/Ycf46/Vps4 family AAA+-type ATPase
VRKPRDNKENILTGKHIGTGKTTIAQKIGQIYYNMGFLASPKVEECSASDLVGEYVGYTGPKTKKLFEKAIGQVLFIDEAYRLGEGRFAQEAVDKLVGLLTQDQFKSKIVVVLAGYERDINKLLNVNSGLSSRFPDIIAFKNIPPKTCLEILDKALHRKKIILAELRNPSSKGYSALESMIEDLSSLPLWANARDMETLAKQMSSLVLKQLPDSEQLGELTLEVKDAIDVMFKMLDEHRSRSNIPPVSRSRYEGTLEELSSNPPPSNPPSPPAPTQHSSLPPPPIPPAPKGP